MRAINSAFYERLQRDGLQIAEIIELSTRTQTFRWTTCNVPIISSGNIYEPFPGQSLKGVEESTDLGVSISDFTVANTGDIRSLVKGNQIDMADVVISRIFPDTPDLGRLEIYRGQIGDYTYNRHQVTGQARSQMQGNNQMWPYYTYMDVCAWRFGGTGCGFDTSSITVTTSLIVSSSTTQLLRSATGAIANSFSPGQLEFGKLTMLSGANSGQVRTIIGNSGDLLILSHPLPFPISSGQLISVYPGCRKRLTEDCRSRFNNSSAWLGFKWIPRQENAF
jgi:uncharacterized phage protein (TIGR02218 family)